MRTLTILILGGSLFCLSGCGEKPATSPPAATTPPAPEPKNVTPSAVEPAPVTPPPASPVNAPPAPGAAAPLKETGEVNGLVRLEERREGQPAKLDNEEVIRRAIMIYVEGMGKPFPTKVQELVDAGILKSVPPAPDGKQWMIEQKPLKIVAR